jgi:hypothetical protein
VNVALIIAAASVVLAIVVPLLVADLGRRSADRSTRDAMDDLWQENASVYRELLWLGQQNEGLQRRVRELEESLPGDRFAERVDDVDLSRLSLVDPWPSGAS